MSVIYSIIAVLPLLGEIVGIFLLPSSDVLHGMEEVSIVLGWIICTIFAFIHLAAWLGINKMWKKYSEDTAPEDTPPIKINRTELILKSHEVNEDIATEEQFSEYEEYCSEPEGVEFQAEKEETEK
ncbi:MAG: hypothetical protein IJU84_08110 [Clostridia bacterium]|nr:hypothetical protein [Clostridia bacterium]